MRKATKASWPVRLHSASSCIFTCEYDRCVDARGLRGAQLRRWLARLKQACSGVHMAARVAHTCPRMLLERP